MGTEDQILKSFPHVPNTSVRLWVQAKPVMTRVSGHCSRIPTVPTVFLRHIEQAALSTHVRLRIPGKASFLGHNTNKRSPKSDRSTKSDRLAKNDRRPHPLPTRLKRKQNRLKSITYEQVNHIGGGCSAQKRSLFCLNTRGQKYKKRSLFGLNTLGQK